MFYFALCELTKKKKSSIRTFINFGFTIGAFLGLLLGIFFWVISFLLNFNHGTLDVFLYITQTILLIIIGAFLGAILSSIDFVLISKQYKNKEN